MFPGKRISRKTPGKMADIKPAKKIFLFPRRSILNLKPTSYRQYPVIIIGVMVLTLAAVFAKNNFLGRADTATLYPTNCLGNWTNTQNAAGIPENKDANTFDPDNFTASNSAILDAPAQQIFCGQFGTASGQIDPSAQFFSAILHVAIVYKNYASSTNVVATSIPIITPSPSPISIQSLGASIVSIIAATPSPTPSPIGGGGTSPESPSPSPEINPSPSPSPALTDEPSPSSEISVNPSPETSPSPTESPSPSPEISASPSPSLTDEPTPSPSPALTSEPSPSPTPSNSPTPSPTSAPNSSPTPISNPSPSPATSPSPSPAISPSPSPIPSPSPSPIPSPSPSPQLPSPSPSPSPSPIASPSPTSAPDNGTSSASLFRQLFPAALAAETSSLTAASQPDILKISYSQDGTNWIDIATFTPSNVPYDLALPIKTPSDLENLEISVSPLENATFTPAVFLDGMWLDLNYSVPSPTPTIPTPSPVLTTPTPSEPTPTPEPQAIFDQNAKHSCSIDPFSQTVRAGSNILLPTKIHFTAENIGDAYRFFTGTLPAGINIFFQQADGVLQKDNTGNLSISISADANRASYSLIIGYEERSAVSDSNTLCQLNLIVK